MPTEINQFKGVTNYGDANNNEQIEANLVSFLNWGFLNIGAFTNVSLDDTFAYGGDESKLNLLTQDGYTDGQVWRSAHKDLIYESGIQYGTEPISISGVWVGGIFRAPTASGYEHYVNYPEGKVVFDSAIDTGSSVQMEYSYRDVHVDVADESLIQDLQKRAWRFESSHFNQAGSGDWDSSPAMNVQMPAVMIEVINNRNFEPYQLGGGQWILQDVLLHVLTETDYECKQILDIISTQNDITLWFYNLNTVIASGDAPLDFKGAFVSDSPSYLDLVSETGHRWKKVDIRNVSVRERRRLNQTLFVGIVRMGLEFIDASI